MERWADAVDTAVGGWDGDPAALAKLFRLHLTALKACPRNPRVINSLGQLYASTDRPMEALSCFKQALSIDAAFALAAENLAALKSSSVDRWHFKMLNDSRRNAAYRTAIQQCVNSNTVALDIGSGTLFFLPWLLHGHGLVSHFTGTGILSMLCVDAGARHVLAVESSPVMANICAATIKGCGARYDKGITRLIAHSQALHRDAFPVLPSVLVTEVVDCGLLGEGVLGTVRHALQTLLAPGARCIPAGATVFATCVSSDYLRQKIAVTAGGPHSIPALSCSAPYLCERLVAVPHTALSPSQPLFHVALDGRPVAAPAVSGVPVLSVLDAKLSTQVHTTSLPVSAAGVVDGIAVWFHLYLTESAFDAAVWGRGALQPDTTLSTAPDADSCWDQAVFPLRQTVRAEMQFDGPCRPLPVAVGA